ncbi:hypothetical protein D3C79_866770 [compost metagenome]
MAAMMRRPLAKSFSTTQAWYSATCSRGMKLEPAQTQLCAPQAKNSRAWSSQPQDTAICGYWQARRCNWAMSPELSLIATMFFRPATASKNSGPMLTLMRPG